MMSPSGRKAIGKYLQEKRTDAGLTQAEVASRLKLKSAQSISNIERGLAPPPSNVLRNMIVYYKISEKEIMDFLTQIQVQEWRSRLFGKTRRA